MRTPGLFWYQEEDMAMSHMGLTKLVEECGELTQIAAKKIAYPDTNLHPDGAGNMLRRLEEEIADVVAACGFVVEKMGLNSRRIGLRSQNKLTLFRSWDGEAKGKQTPETDTPGTPA